MFFRRDENSLKSRRQRRMEEIEELKELQKETHLEKGDFLALVIAAMTTLVPVAVGIILVYYFVAWLLF